MPLSPISPLVSNLQKCLPIAVAETTVGITASWWHQAVGCWKASLNFSGADLSGHVHADCVPCVFSGVMALAQGHSQEDIFVDAGGNCQ